MQIYIHKLHYRNLVTEFGLRNLSSLKKMRSKNIQVLEFIRHTRRTIIFTIANKVKARLKIFTGIRKL